MLPSASLCIEKNPRRWSGGVSRDQASVEQEPCRSVHRHEAAAIGAGLRRIRADDPVHHIGLEDGARHAICRSQRELEALEAGRGKGQEKSGHAGDFCTAVERGATGTGSCLVDKIHAAACTGQSADPLVARECDSVQIHFNRIRGSTLRVIACHDDGVGCRHA